MKTVHLLYVYLFIFLQYISGQNIVLYSSNDIRININSDKENYTVWRKPVDQLIKVPYISTGKVLFSNDLLICIDTITKERIILKKVDKYRLIVNNKNSLFSTKEILYAIKISDSKGHLLENIGWKNGKRNGYWCFYSDKGVDFVFYENGRIIKRYFKTHKELDEEAMKGSAIL
jgi:hypothetical protein